MLKKLSLKQKMILGGGVAVFLPFFVAGVVIYFQLSKSLLEISKNKAVHYAEDVAVLFDAKLKQELMLASAIAADPDIIESLAEGNYQQAQIEIDDIFNSIGNDSFTIFILDNTGAVRADATFKEQIGLDLSDRPYFQNAKQGETGAAGPMFTRGKAILEEATILVYAPVQKDTFFGVVAIPFSIASLVDIILEKKSGETGFAYVVDSNGLVLLHPKKELSLKINLKELPGTEEVVELIGEKKSGAASTFLVGTEQIIGLATAKLTGWKIVFSQDKEEIMKPVNRLLRTILLSGLLFLVLTILIITVLSRKISTPIQKLMEIMKQVTEHSSEIILHIGTHRKIKFANPAFEKLTGLRSEEIIGTELELDNHKKIPSEKIWEYLEKGSIWSGRVWIKGYDKKKITMDVMLVPFRNDKGAIEGYIEIGRDITNELMYEQRLQQSQKLEAIGTLAGGIAHDFNNIISGISGFAELTLMVGNCDAEAADNMREIIQAAERAHDLVSQILTFSRETKVELRPLLPKSVLKEALKLLGATIQAKIKIESNINSDAAITAEPTQIHQIVMNLFMNAAHAIGGNAGTIKIELEDYIVDEAFTHMHPNVKTGKHILLRVSDTGSGIEQEHLNKIFEPFYTTKAPGEGTGLGLSMVHGIVKKLDGIITAYSEVGKGTVFNIIIPVVEIDDSVLDEKETEIKKGTEKVAIIDDETAIAASLHSILTNLGYHVKAFTDSMEALTSIKSSPGDFDLIITDYSMPQVTGLELAKALRKEGIDIPMILTSGFLGQGMEKIARDSGISAFITKPINTYQLTNAIRSILTDA